MKRPSYHVVRPDEAYGHVPPAAQDEADLLGWNISPLHEGALEPHSILLSDTGIGNPPLGEVVKVICHEELHAIIEDVDSCRASNMLDRLVTDGDFIVDRPENHIEDDRPVKDMGEYNL